jgi:ISXO2-like transposase domain
MLRSVLVRPGRDQPVGTVEVDETLIGGEEPGLPSGRARGKKVLTGIAVEARQQKGIGRCRMALLADGSSASLHPFVTGHVEPGATVITDAWMGYHGQAASGACWKQKSGWASSMHRTWTRTAPAKCSPIQHTATWPHCRGAIRGAPPQ